MTHYHNPDPERLFAVIVLGFIWLLGLFAVAMIIAAILDLIGVKP